ncbi:MAG: 30S ribosomal protein S13 [Planctomycetota bacterium]|jgi:small subunit ribosomal protein S13
MARIQGIDLPNNKEVGIALTYIHGIGKHKAKLILGVTNVEWRTRVRNLTDDEVTRIANEIDGTHVVEGQLRRVVGQNIQRLKEINCYRGIRHRRGLPVRGQRTRTNARGRKGPKRTVATKKSIKQMR